MHNITLTLTADEMSRLADLLAEAAMASEDDGNEGNPDATLLWKVQKVVRKASN